MGGAKLLTFFKILTINLKKTYPHFIHNQKTKDKNNFSFQGLS